MSHRPVPSLAAALLALATGAACAQATIDQNKALAGGVTPADGAGFPVTISAPGHYVLKSNLVVPAGMIGIEITASDVTLDLNGFSVVGPGTCTQNPTSRAVTCSQPKGAAQGIYSPYANTSRTVVRNGTVRGFNGGGLWLRADATIEGVRAMHNSSNGIAVEGGSGTSRVSDSVAELNAGSGMRIFSTGGIVDRSRAAMNGGDGIHTYGYFAVTQTVTLNNAYNGLQYGAVRGTVSWGNGTNRKGVTSLGGNLDGATVY